MTSNISPIFIGKNIIIKNVTIDYIGNDILNSFILTQGNNIFFSYINTNIALIQYFGNHIKAKYIIYKNSEINSLIGDNSENIIINRVFISGILNKNKSQVYVGLLPNNVHVYNSIYKI